jgi:hypothetical protein
MEESLNKKYVNISNRKFENKIYNEEGNNIFSYKPNNAFWLSLVSDKNGFYSEWDEEYRSAYENNTDENGNLHATTFSLKPNTYIMSPSNDSVILEGFNNFVKGKNLTPDQKRKLLVELVKKQTNNSDIEHIICQIDLVEDLTTMEKIFCGYECGNTYPSEVYDNLALNIKKAFRENFSGVEVTGFALGLDELSYGDGIDDAQIYMSSKDPNYNETIGYWEIPSLAVFDTSCLDLIKEVEFPAKDSKNKEYEEGDIEY